ncbi:E3 ubiquitin-protein transferase RMND5A [Galemys pyrenaicus]|uniref:E3 ubiquitin-protein transferase RMND5A n=1 Tax=Galemys pyrenaicus TaxID=202257 RepID=A0A8J6DLP8_GALPY|nr:E3 ubiquitin-protein transferase RMND5A [Galemys pyrenaicus]
MGDEEQDAASAGPGPNGCGHPGAGELSASTSGMDQCVTVERELEKVLHKFSGYGQLCERGLEELIDYTGGLKHEILQSHGRGGPGGVAFRRPGSRLPPGAEAPGPLDLPIFLYLPRTCPDLLVNSDVLVNGFPPGNLSRDLGLQPG